jgi:hypothetical protein
MNKIKINYLIDMMLLISFITVAISGLVMLYVHSYKWSTIHNWSGIITILLAALHFILHWKWLKEASKNIFKKK